MSVERESLRSQLVATAAAYRHAHEEHRRARRGGHTRRRLDARLEKLSGDFERLLADAALDEVMCEKWPRHLYHGTAEPDLPTPEPASPAAAHRPPSNRGRGSAPLWQR
ncbi:MAG: hypothetical protein ACXVRK_02865 [Gaiellaceae bacterium]